jgi:hypothetical protein
VVLQLISWKNIAISNRFVRTNGLAEDVILIEARIHENAHTFNDQHGDEWDEKLEALLDSEEESDSDQEHEDLLPITNFYILNDFLYHL